MPAITPEIRILLEHLEAQQDFSFDHLDCIDDPFLHGIVRALSDEKRAHLFDLVQSLSRHLGDDGGTIKFSAETTPTQNSSWPLTGDAEASFCALRDDGERLVKAYDAALAACDVSPICEILGQQREEARRSLAYISQEYRDAA